MNVFATIAQLVTSLFATKGAVQNLLRGLYDLTFATDEANKLTGSVIK